MTLALVLSLSLAAPTDRPGRDVVLLERAELVTAAGELRRVEGGAYLSDDDLVSLGREVVALRAENEQLREGWAEERPATSTLVLVAVLGLVAGGVTGALVTRLAR